MQLQNKSNNYRSSSLLKLDELHSTIDKIIGHDQLNYAKVQGSRREVEMFYKL
jgi:hypothetical protein